MSECRCGHLERKNWGHTPLACGGPTLDAAQRAAERIHDVGMLYMEWDDKTTDQVAAIIREELAR